MNHVIEVENLSKCYQIAHLNAPLYSTLVETLSKKAKSLFQKRDKPSTEQFWALKELNFTIEEGDRVALIGRNGAGKSTLLKVLSRITHPTTGTVRIRGRVASLLEVGTGFHPELTGRENIFLNGAILGMSKKEICRKFDEIVAFSEVEKFLDTPIKRYSSGMHMRLGFAVAAHLDPDLLIIDEVLSVGDARFQEKCLNKLDQLSSGGRTVLYVSHDMNSVVNLCNKGIYLEKGAIHTQGAIDTCVAAYMRNQRSIHSSWHGDVGDQHLRIYDASLSTLNTERDFFYQGEAVNLQIDYEVISDVPDLIIGFDILNQRNQLLGRAHTWDDAKTVHQFMRPGKHRAIYTIDTNMLHEGEYLVRLNCFIHNRYSIAQDQVFLKLPIYSNPEARRYLSLPNHDGISFGRHWNLEKITGGSQRS